MTHDDDTVPLRVTEETDRVVHVPTARELAEQRRYAWTRIPSHDSVPSGRLRIDVGGLWQAERRSFWADRQSWQLEDKLPEAFREIAVRLDELQQLRQARDAAQIEYQAAVEQEEARARERAAEAHRVTVLDEQLGRWREVGELRRYAEAVRQRIELAASADGQDADALATAQRWLVWIDQRAERRDPLQQLPTMPEPPRLPSYKLAEFMRRVPEPEHFRYRPPEY